ncbi:hypothetical protein RhiirA5_374544 [Rhizophagus irregularis]|uniref:F-box domain-containing protein n=2 Tax=Rhizophagus irregularis TaxID=588596 RepID=A0A2N0RNH2_9GLOM|nr:hypothetical protein RhiirA5_374544 [Rhizophagus irregularis]PKC64864.1 hypothetical protein RhiirA1_461809 [Rhizophagus irregularis]PKC70346.1 hypothetical protein RhiirA1_454868 [Rhizophagus irregularis]CAB4373655.1 unnamed protein product [Rhizophagus irregularis]CAB4487260.1 unnamed protein product [Rhizophagus irregularis]
MSRNQDITSTVNLPVDCIYEIIQYVVHDVKTLYSCVVLNQDFFQVVARVLWKNPFKYIKQDETKKALIFRTYFSCLDDQEKEQVTTFFNSVFDFPKPFINYPSFLQEFEIFNIQTSMRSFLYQYYSATTTENKINSIVHILNPFMEKLFFNAQSNFKYVSVDLNDEKNQIDMSSFDDRILCHILSNINKFTFGFGFKFDVKIMEILKFIQENATKLTEIISDYNKNINHVRLTFTKKEFKQQKFKKLNPKFNDLLDILNSFIISLDNLKSLEIPCFVKNENFAKKHSHSLTHLKLHEIRNFNIIVSILDHCLNLETIELVNFHCNKNTDITELDKPINSKFKNLKNFHITISYFSVLTLFKRIIIMSDYDLKTLYYDKYIIHSNVNKFTKSIWPFCTNITHLFIRIFQNDLCTIVSFLKSLNYLVFLKLDWDNYLGTDQIVDLAHSFSSSLQILEILEIDSSMMIEILGDLFRNMQCHLREIGIRMDSSINDDILEIIIAYARRKNSLIVFRYLNIPSYRYYYPQVSRRILEEAKSLFTIDDNPEPFKRSFIEPIF